jgi:hypothetical protein
MPGSNSQYFLFKLTVDAARLMNAPRKFRVCTTVIAQLISAGVKGPWGTWGAAIVQHMVEKPQSNLWAFCAATWFGKDSQPELVTGIQPLFEEGMQLEEGARFDLPQSRAPWSYKRKPLDPTTGIRPAGEFRGGSKTLCTEPGTKANKFMMPRAWLVLSILMYARLYVAVDGATHFALTDVSVQSACNDAYTNEKKKECAMLLHIVPIHAGETLGHVCERLQPGSTDSKSHHHWFYEAAVMGNAHSDNAEAGDITRLPPRKESTTPMKKSLSGTSDGRTTVVLEPYVDPVIEQCKYDSKAFKPAIDTSQGDPNVPVTELGLVRMPVIPELFTRSLPGALWNEKKWGPFTKRLGLCIIHGLMRTGESNFEGGTMLLRSIFAGNAIACTSSKTNDKKIIQKHLIDFITEHLKVRAIIGVDNKGKLYDLSLNGGEAEALVDDLASTSPKEKAEGGTSFVLYALRKTFTLLGFRPEVSHIDEWAGILQHWALAMQAGLVMRGPAAEMAAHKLSFALNARLYVLKKAMLNKDLLVWYDWQVYSTFPHLFDIGGPPRAFCQEGMEAIQKANNSLQRHGNNGANGGRKPNLTVALLKEYMANRLARMLTPAQWLWKQQLFRFMGEWHMRFELAEQLRQEGNVGDWELQQVPEYRSFVVMTSVYCRLAATFWRMKARHADVERGQRGEPAKHHYVAMLLQHRAYYAPVECETDRSIYAYPLKEQRHRVSAARKARWAALGKREARGPKAARLEEQGAWVTNGQLMYKPVYSRQPGPKRTQAEYDEYDGSHKGIRLKHLVRRD